MRPGSVAGGRHVELAGIGLGVGDEFGDRLRRKRWMHLHAVILVADARDRRDVADKILFDHLVEGIPHAVAPDAQRDELSPLHSITSCPTRRPRY
jgi:hypothetical protein